MHCKLWQKVLITWLTWRISAYEILKRHFSYRNTSLAEKNQKNCGDSFFHKWRSCKSSSNSNFFKNGPKELELHNSENWGMDPALVHGRRRWQDNGWRKTTCHLGMEEENMSAGRCLKLASAVGLERGKVNWEEEDGRKGGKIVPHSFPREIRTEKVRPSWKVSSRGRRRRRIEPLNLKKSNLHGVWKFRPNASSYAPPPPPWQPLLPPVFARSPFFPLSTSTLKVRKFGNWLASSPPSTSYFSITINFLRSQLGLQLKVQK